jgi:hypothetical protein
MRASLSRLSISTRGGKVQGGGFIYLTRSVPEGAPAIGKNTTEMAEKAQVTGANARSRKRRF